MRTDLILKIRHEFFRTLNADKQKWEDKSFFPFIFQTKLMLLEIILMRDKTTQYWRYHRILLLFIWKNYRINYWKWALWCLISIYESLALRFYRIFQLLFLHFIFIPPWNWVDTFWNHYFQLFTQENHAHRGHISCKRYDSESLFKTRSMKQTTYVDSWVVWYDIKKSEIFSQIKILTI